MASSGLIPVLGSLPSKNSFTSYLIFGILVEPPTNTISSIDAFSNSTSFRACCTGFIVFLNKSLHNSSNLALDKFSEKSNPGTKSSISIVTSCVLLKVLFAFSTSFFSF